MSDSGLATVRFTAFDDVGVPIPAGVFDLKGAYTYDGNDYTKERWNQRGKRTLDGGLNVEDNGIVIVSSQIRVKSVVQQDGYDFMTWITDIILFRRFRFDAEPLNPLLDIGGGLGVKVLKANMTVSNTTGIFIDGPPDLWEINFPFQFKE